jgi:hypothetical protein
VIQQKRQTGNKCGQGQIWEIGKDDDIRRDNKHAINSYPYSKILHLIKMRGLLLKLLKRVPLFPLIRYF